MSELSSPSMLSRLPQGCVEDVDRHGNVRIYYRRRGFRKVRLKGTPWTPEFMAAYDAAKRIAAPAHSGRPTLPNTWSWLCLRYFAECTEYKLLELRTQYVRRQILESTFDELIRPNSDSDSLIYRSRVWTVMQSRCCGTASYQHRRLPTRSVKAIRQVFKWGVAKGQAPSNPAREVSYIKSGSEGFHTLVPGGSATIRGTAPGGD